MATTLELPSTPDVAYFTQGAILGAGVTHTEDDDGLHIKGLKVFRTGLLYDSEGRAHDWTEDELDAAVENFTALRSELPDVPVRVGHNRDTTKVIGYYEDVRRDSNFLVADILITEPDHAAKVKRKTYRSRSLEIGAYPSAKYGLSWPVVLGLAFVDIPAVTGLYESPVGKQFTVVQESGTMPDVNKPVNNESLFAAYYAQGMVDGGAAVKPPAYQCFGAPETDPTKVQAHIATLETYQKEAMEGHRKTFVKGLVDQKILLATQSESFEKLALGMSADQYAEFEKAWAGAQANPLLQEHGGGNHGGAGAGNEKTPAQLQIEHLEAVVQFHRDGGRDDTFIFALPSYKELQALKGTK